LSATRYTYDRFPASVRSEEQEEKRKQILAAASGALESNGRHPPRYILICLEQRYDSLTYFLLSSNCSSPPGKNTKEDNFSSMERAVSVACNPVAIAWLQTNQYDMKRCHGSDIVTTVCRQKENEWSWIYKSSCRYFFFFVYLRDSNCKFLE